MNTATFKTNTYELILALMEKVNSEKSTQIAAVYDQWNSYIKNEYTLLQTKFKAFAETSDSDEIFEFVPVATTVANIERLFEVLIADFPNDTIQTIATKSPERWRDLQCILQHYLSNIETLKPTDYG